MKLGFCRVWFGDSDMAPTRKRGLNKVKTTTELCFGDLVLAKVRGFPAWPAKVSRPQDWERAPDPRKYFVQFFGTQEIAFVAPADIQPFTSESKSKLLARCKGKTVQYFAQAVKEICEAFEELQENYPGGANDNIDRSTRWDAGNTERRDVKGSHAKHEWDNYGFGPTPSLGDFSCEDGMLDTKPDKQAFFAKETSRFPDNPEMFKDLVKDGACRPKECGPSASNQIPVLSGKDETNINEKQEDALVFSERIQSSRASSSSPYSVHWEDAIHHKAEKKDSSASVGTSNRHKVPVGDNKAANGHKSKDLIAGSKRKLDGLNHHTDDFKFGKHIKDQVLGKVSSGGNARQSPGSNRLQSNPHGRAMKNPLKDQKHLDVIKSTVDAISSPTQFRDGDHSKHKNGQVGHERSQTVRKAKQITVRSDDETVLPPSKRNRAVEALSDAKKRRAVHLCGGDDDDAPKTPVHGGSSSATKVKSSTVISVSGEKASQNHEIATCSGENMKGSSADGGGTKKCVLHVDGSLVSSSSEDAPVLQKEDNLLKSQPPFVPVVEDSEKQPVKEAKIELISPLKSPAVTPVKKIVDHPKPYRPTSKGSLTGLHAKAHNSSAKGSNLVSTAPDSYDKQVSIQKSRQDLSGDMPKGIPTMRLNEPDFSVDSQKDMEVGRSEDIKDKPSSLVDPKVSDSSTSMKHLIAAAQAKRRQAQMQNTPHDNGNSVMGLISNLPGRSPSPSSAGQPQPSGGVTTVTALDAVGVETRECFVSPSRGSSGLQNQLNSKEPEDKELSSSHLAAGNTLSGGTEAAVARDAFEGMIETLSRTKESIGRATRLAIDCAKYGIADEVVDLLTRKLENEASLHRKVDLFFLVDSITQCSHSQKGIAGASYIPAVQAALSRILGAAAPPGTSARENRRQCLKVLRLWRERKILPESVLRHGMDDISSSNDDSSSGLSHRRPSRAERSVDDPIREMEGMLVDEYGSNATFNLPGFLSSRGFADDEEDEDDVPSKSCRESDASPMDVLNAPAGIEAGNVTPADRQHCILEDVDGELEMEDVSEHLKDISASPDNLLELNKQGMDLDADMESSGKSSIEPTSEGSPPLPIEPPPPLPPLPTSPPPPLPPLLSSPPPPLPPCSLPSHPPSPPASLPSQLPPPTSASLPSQPPPPPSASLPSQPPPPPASLLSQPPPPPPASLPSQPPPPPPPPPACPPSQPPLPSASLTSQPPPPPPPARPPSQPPLPPASLTSQLPPPPAPACPPSQPPPPPACPPSQPPSPPASLPSQPPPPPASLPSQPPPPPASLPSQHSPSPPASLPSQLLPPSASIPTQAPRPPPASIASLPPLPPASLPSQLPPPVLPSGSAQAGVVQPQLTTQPTVSSQVSIKPQSVLPLGQAPLLSNGSLATGSHLVQRAGNSQLVSCFLPVGTSATCDQSAYSSRPLEYGQGNMYARPPAPQAGQPNQQFLKSQQFQPCQAISAQRPFTSVPVPQPHPNHFSYNNPSVQQHMSHPLTHPSPHPPPPPPPHRYYSASHPDGLRRYADEQWRSASVEFKPDKPHNTWLNGGQKPSETIYPGEAAYFRPPERLPANNMGYQVSTPNPALGGPASGRAINHMMPSRPDVTALNRWRPV